MSRLSPEAEQLVRSGRAVLQPTDADRERVFLGLAQRAAMLPNAQPGTTEPSGAPAAGQVTLAKVVGVVAGIVMAGAGVYFALRSEPSASADPPAPTPPALVQPARATPETVAEPSSLPSVSVDDLPQVLPSRGAENSPSAVPPRAASNRRPALRSADHLSREVALLSRASSELHAGRPAAALEALDEHARYFPSGALAQERAAGRARALCALGRTKEAQLELAKLVPGSPHATRAAKACSVTPVERR